jgi:aminotransferase
LHAPDWTFDEADLAAAFNERTRGIVINTPNNPTGKVFTREELDVIAGLCQRWGVVVFTDEIYEHILYDGAVHVPPGSVPGLEDRTVTISALSKTYSVTGWRVGWVVAPAPLSRGIRSVHDFLTVAAPAPLQEAGETALALPEEYYRVMADEYLDRRDLWIDTLREVGFVVEPPKGAYYVMADIGAFGFPDDTRFARHMVEDVGVAVVPGSSFFSRPEDGAHLVRFAFCKKLETLKEAGERLRTLKPRSVSP